MYPKLKLAQDACNPVQKQRNSTLKNAARSDWLAAATEDIERLEAKVAESLFADKFHEARVLLVGFSADHLCDTRRNLRLIGVEAVASTSDVGQLQNLSEMDFGFTHIVVNFDAFSDVEAGVEALIELRSNAPSLIIVACSEMISGDDLGRERSLICDATLKLPVSKSRLEQGLLIAFLNHA
jgi:hypothetical protein